MFNSLNHTRQALPERRLNRHWSEFYKLRIFVASYYGFFRHKPDVHCSNVAHRVGKELCSVRSGDWSLRLRLRTAKGREAWENIFLVCVAISLLVIEFREHRPEVREHVYRCWARQRYAILFVHIFRIRCCEYWIIEMIKNSRWSCGMAPVTHPGTESNEKLLNSRIDLTEWIPELKSNSYHSDGGVSVIFMVTGWDCHGYRKAEATSVVLITKGLCRSSCFSMMSHALHSQWKAEV